MDSLNFSAITLSMGSQERAVDNPPERSSRCIHSTVLESDDSRNSLSLLCENAKLASGSVAFTQNSSRFREPTSWIKKDAEVVLPPPSPIAVVANFSELSRNDWCLSNRSLVQMDSPRLHPVPENKLPKQNLSVITNGVDILGSEGKVRAMAAKFSPRSSVEPAMTESESKVQAMVSVFSQKTNTSRILVESTMNASLRNHLHASSETIPSTLKPKARAPPAPKPHIVQADGDAQRASTKNPLAQAEVINTPLQSVASLSKMFDHPSKAPLPKHVAVTVQSQTTPTSANGTSCTPHSLPASAETSFVSPMESKPAVSATHSHHSAGNIERDVVFRSVGSSKVLTPPRWRSEASFANESEEKDSNANDVPILAIASSVVLERSPFLDKSEESYKKTLTEDDVLDRPYREFYKAVLEVVTNELTFISNWHRANKLLIKPLIERLGPDRTMRLIPLPCWDNIFRFHEALFAEMMATLSYLCGESFATFEDGKRFGESTTVTLELNDLIPKSLLELEEYSEKLKSITLLEHVLTKDCVRKWFESLNAVMMRHADALMIARDFIVNYPSAVDYLENMSTKKKAFLVTLEQNLELEGLRFRDFLIQPVQNMCRYHLLYKTVTEKAPIPELAALASAGQTKFASITQRVNESMKNEDRRNAEHLMNRIKSSVANGGNVNGGLSNRFSGRLLAKGLFPLQRHSSTETTEDEFGLNDVTSVPLREGGIQIVSFQVLPLLSPTEADEFRIHQQTADFLITKGKLHGLLCKNQLLVMDMVDKRKSKPMIQHSFRFNEGWHSVRVEEDDDLPEVIHLILVKASTGEDPRTIELDYAISLGAELHRSGWIKDLTEVAKVVDNARQREQMVRRKSKPVAMSKSPDSVGSETKSMPGDYPTHSV